MSQKQLSQISAGIALSQLFLLSQGIPPVKAGESSVVKIGDRNAVACSYSISKENVNVVSSFEFSQEITDLLYGCEIFYEVGFYTSQLLIDYYIDGTAKLTFLLYFNE